MKRSEFIKDMTALYVRAGWDHGQAERQAIFDANRNQRECSVPWDPEEPEILWTGWPHRYTSAGWQVFVAGEWVTLAIPSRVFDELARRILAEREERAQGHEAAHRHLVEKGKKWRQRAETAEETAAIERQKNVALQKEIDGLRCQVKAQVQVIVEDGRRAENLRAEIEKLRCQVKAQSQVIAEDGATTAREEKWKEEALHAYKELNERNKRLSRIRAALDDTATNDEDRKLSNVRTALEA